jgi:RNA recognition motif-containing protein
LPAFIKRRIIMNIFVGNLSFKTTEQELQREFEAFGEVESVKIIIDRETLKSRGFAFVEMRDKDQALAAIAGTNGKELGGQILKVNEARPREARGGESRERSGGGYGSGGRPGGGGYGSRDRGGRGFDSRDGGSDIYDTKGGRSGGGYGNRGRSGRGSSGSGGRSGGGGGRRGR